MTTESAHAGPEAGAESLIDAHSHIWDQNTTDYPLAGGLTARDLDPPSFSADELLAICRPQGVQRVVLIQHTVYHRFDNSYIVDAIAKQPAVFSGVACVDDRAERPGAAMVELKRRGIRGFRIVPAILTEPRETLTPDVWLTGTGMREMWRTAAQENLAMCPLINPEYIPSVAAMCEEFRDTRVVLDHFARIGIDGTLRAADIGNLCGLANHPNTYVKISAYYALGEKRPPHTELIPMIRRLLDAFGPERLMWASDAPYQVVAPNNYAASINLIKTGIGSLTDHDRSWLLSKTAENVFFTES